MIIGFRDFYNKIKGIVDEVNPSSRISSLSADKSALVYSALGNNEKRKLVVVKICHNDSEIGQNEARRSYVSLAEELCLDKQCFPQFDSSDVETIYYEQNNDKSEESFDIKISLNCS